MNSDILQTQELPDQENQPVGDQISQNSIAQWVPLKSRENIPFE